MPINLIDLSRFRKILFWLLENVNFVFNIRSDGDLVDVLFRIIFFLVSLQNKKRKYEKQSIWIESEKSFMLFVYHSEFLLLLKYNYFQFMR